MWQDLADRWSRPENAHEVSLANLPSGPEDAGIEVVDVIQSLVEGRGERYIVNVRNGVVRIPNLPALEAIVEVQAVVDAYGTGPFATAQPLRESLAGAACTSTGAGDDGSAALTGDRGLLRQVILADPLVAATLEPHQTEALTDELLEVNARYLPRFASSIGGAA